MIRIGIYGYGNLGRGVESSMIMAMECYHEYLEAATPKHSKFLSAHYHLAKISTKMGDMCKESGMKEETTNFYNYAVEHYLGENISQYGIVFTSKVIIRNIVSNLQYSGSDVWLLGLNPKTEKAEKKIDIF